MTAAPPTQRPTASPLDTASADRPARRLLETGTGVAEALDRVAAEVAAFDPWAPPPAGPGLLLAAVAATHPDAIGAEVADAGAALLARADLTRVWQPAVDEVFRLLDLLIPTPAAAELPPLLATVLGAAGVHPRWSERATTLLAALAEWRPEVLDGQVGEVLALVASAPADRRDALFQRVVEPLLLAAPATVTPDRLARAAGLSPDASAARYLAAVLVAHPATTDAVRDAARALGAGRFPLRAAWERLGGNRALRVLCVQNIADAQGDEIVRTVPLLQALLDAHEGTRVTLVTDRAYLYGHERLEAVSFDERGRVARALAAPADVVIDFFEPQPRFFNHDPDVLESLSARGAASPPLLDVRAAKGWNRFTLASVRLGGLEWAPALGIDRPLPGGVYAPSLRLIAELGLPLRVGEQSPRSGPVLAGAGWAGADEPWREVAARNREGRPVVLLNPFGGAVPAKGFVGETFHDLRRLVGALVEEGYFVLLLANGQPWGSYAAAEAVVAGLPRAARSRVAIGPDPARREWPPGTGVRQVLGLAGRADLVVTVEGWLMHAASLLGRPFRVLMLPESVGQEWLPWGRSAAQRIWPFVGEHVPGRPPLPEQPRRLAWLRLLGRVEGDAWLSLLETAARSADLALRAAAARALGRVPGDDVVPLLARLLGDPSHWVRGQAAAALLDGHGGRLDRGDVPAAPVLDAYCRIAAERPDWEALVGIGAAAEPALLAALHGDDPVVRREAATALELLSRARAAAVATAVAPGGRSGGR